MPLTSMRATIGTALALLLASSLTARAAAPASSDSKPTPAPHVKTEREQVDDDGYVVHLAMPTESDHEAWMQSGLRVELAVDHGLLWGTGPAPQLSTWTAHLRTRYRIDRWWSVFATLGYSTASADDYSGSAWTAIVGPMFHPFGQLGLSLGLGYGGLSVSQISTGGQPPPGSTDKISRTLANNETMYSCGGGAWVAQASLEYLLVVGSLFATGPYVRADLQWTGCEESFSGTDTDTGLQAVGRQWWLHRGGDVGWWFSWR